MTRNAVPSRPLRLFRLLECPLFAFALAAALSFASPPDARAAVQPIDGGGSGGSGNGGGSGGFVPIADAWASLPAGGESVSWAAAPYADDELLVQFHAGVSAGDRARVARAEGAIFDRDVTPEGLVQYRLAPGDHVAGAVDRWTRHPEVDYATANLRARPFFVPNDSLINMVDWTWNLRVVQAYDAWDLQTGDPRVIVAIIDSGVAHEDRDVPDYEKAHLWPGTQRYLRSPELPGPFVPGWDFIHDDPYADDDNGHGTTVATIVAGQADNVAGSAGLAFGVTLMPIKVIDYQNDSDMSFIVSGIRFAADHGANIANLSLGFPPLGLFQASLGVPTNVFRSMLRPLREVVNYAQRRGVILVAAAGNFGANEVSLPAGYPGVISVGATNVDNARSSYSSYGKNLSFVAPGGDFTDLNDDHVQDAVFTLSIKPHRSPGSLAKPDSFGVFPFFGTSGAAPHVTGAVALLMSKGYARSGAIEQVLRETALVPFGPAKGLNLEYGDGLIQVADALRMPLSGGKGSQASGSAFARIASPSPSRDGAALAFRLTREGRASVRVFDVRGSLVRTVEHRVLPAGEAVARWDGRNELGMRVPAGIYLFRVETPDGVETRKFAIVR